MAWLKTATRDWMRSLPDSTPLSAISIPGTHDSAALHGGLAAQCQSWTIKDQLEAGIRFIDVRCRSKLSFGVRDHGRAVTGVFKEARAHGSVIGSCKPRLLGQKFIAR
jgi:hypothetical protein